MKRITITIDDALADVIAARARISGMTQNKVISALIRQAAGRPPIKYVRGLPVLDLPKSKRPITTDLVKSLM